MGSLTRRLRKNTTGLSKAAATRIARNLSEHLMQQPLNDAQQGAMQAQLAQMSQHDRIQLIANSLSPTEIRRRLGMSHAEQIATYGFALRGGVGADASDDSAHQ